MELPVAGHIVSGVEIYVSIAQLVKHVVKHFEESLVAHIVINLTLVLTVHLIPVEAILFGLVVEEAVFLIDDVPQSLEVAGGRVVVLFNLCAREKKSESQ